MLDFVIINYNTGDLTCNCIQSVYNTYSNEAGIVVVDNASTDDSIKIISGRFPAVKIIRNQLNLGYAYAVNAGVKATCSELILVSNSDVEFHTGSLEMMEKFMTEESDTGISGFYQFYPGGKPQRSYGNFPGFKLGIMNMFFLCKLKDNLTLNIRKMNLHSCKIKKVEYADGAALLIRRDVFEKLNGFDENFFFYTEETDFCKRVWDLGYRVAMNPLAKITHHRGATSKKVFFNERKEKLLAETKLKFILKHGTKFEANFYKYAQCFHYLALAFKEKLVSILTRKERYAEKSRNHFKNFKLWLNEEVG